MKQLLIFSLVVLSFPLFAQSNIVSSGGSGTGNDGSTITYSVGQIDFVAIESTQGSLYLGNQHPYEIFVLEIDENEIGINYLLYPNPTANNVSLSISQFENSTLKYSLFDTSGKLILEDLIKNDVTSIPLQNLASAIYYLTVFDEKMKALKTFKIIKN